MKIVNIKDYNSFIDKDLCLALGFFDGFHIGHKKILEETIRLSKELNTKSGILTFNESIYEFLSGNIYDYPLMSLSEKIDFAQDMGFDSIYIIELSNDFINLDKDVFIDKFLFNQTKLIMGSDYSFGKNGEGNTNYLKDRLKDKVIVLDIENHNDTKIGTKLIKELLSNGSIEEANQLLGRPYSISGRLYKRNKNIALSSPQKFIPKNGTYLLELCINNEKKTFVGKIKKTLEPNGIIIKSSELILNELKIDKNSKYVINFKTI